MDGYRGRALALIAALAALAGMAITALAAGGDRATDNLVLCSSKREGLSLASKGKCDKGARKLTVAKRGPRGAQGPPGPAGEDGTPADVAPEPKRLVADVVASPACAANPGAFCGAPGFAPRWMNLPSAVGGDGPPVSFQKDAGGFVHLEGEAWRGANGSPGGPDAAAIFHLPPGYRPTTGTVEAMGSGCVESMRIEIRSDGAVVPQGSDVCVVLDGISFHP